MGRKESKAGPPPTVTESGRTAVVGPCQLPWVSRKGREVSGLWNFPNIGNTFSPNQCALDPSSEGEALRHAALSSAGTLCTCSLHRLPGGQGRREEGQLGSSRDSPAGPQRLEVGASKQCPGKASPQASFWPDSLPSSHTEHTLGARQHLELPAGPWPPCQERPVPCWLVKC